MGFKVPNGSDQGGYNYEPVPADNHVGILIGITDLGTHMESYKGGAPKPKHKVRFQWELPGVTRADNKTATISAKYTVSLHENSRLGPMLETWLGRDWNKGREGGTWEFLLETPALVLVENVPDKQDPKRTFSVVKSVSKLPKGMPAPEATRDTFYLSLDDKHLPEKLSLRDAEFIRQSEEYKAGGFKDDAPRPGDERGRPDAGQRPQQPGYAGASASRPGFDETASTAPFDTGKQLFGWVKDQEQLYEVGLLKYLNNWGKLHEFPGRMVDWDAGQVALAYNEAVRKLRAIQPEPAAVAGNEDEDEFGF